MYRNQIHDLLFEFRDLVFLIYKMNSFPRTDGGSGDLQIGFTHKGDLLTFDGNNFEYTECYCKVYRYKW